MASDFMSYGEVLAELQMTREQLEEILKAGKLRAFLDGGQKKFRVADVKEYKRLAESQATVMQAPDEDGSGSKLDLSDIESEPGADVADQTSVLRVPTDGEETPVGGSEEPVFDFSEEAEESPVGAGGEPGKLDLSEIEAEPGADVADQTSVLRVPADGEEAPVGGSEEPAFDFSEEVEESPVGAGDETGKLDLSEIEAEPGADVADQTSVLPAGDAEESPPAGQPEEPVFDFSEEEEPSDSVLVADESESSADILQVAEEVGDESSSDLAAVAVDEGSKSSSSELSDTDLVADILEGADQGDDDDALETVDLSELDAAEQGETAVDGATAADELLTQIDAGDEGSSAETALVPGQDAYDTDAGEEETVGLDQTEADTEGVGETLLEEGVEEVEGLEGEQVFESGIGPAPPVMVTPMMDNPSAFANVALAFSGALLLFGGFMMMAGTLARPLQNQFTKAIADFFVNTFGL